MKIGNKKENRTGKGISIFVAALAIFALLGAGIAGAHQSPANCKTVGLGISIAEGPAIYHANDVINYIVTLVLPKATDCDVSDITLTLTKPDGTTTTVTGINLNQSQNTKDIGPFPYTVQPGDKIVTAKASALSADAHSVIIHQNVSASAEISAMVIYPAITVLKTCTPATQVAPGTITWKVVTNNTGDTPLETNVTDSMHGTIFAGLLAPWASNENVNVDSGLAAGIYNNIATATGTDMLGKQVSTSSSATCSVTSPGKPGKVVGWGLIGNKLNPDIEVKIWDYKNMGKIETKDYGHKLTIVSTELNSVLVNKEVVPQTAEIRGKARTNNEEQSFEFIVWITDGGNPPDNGEDTFKMSIPAKGYSAGGSLSAGNIDIVKYT